MYGPKGPSWPVRLLTIDLNVISDVRYTERQKKLTTSNSERRSLKSTALKINHIWTLISYNTPYEAHLKNQRVSFVKKEKMRWNRKNFIVLSYSFLKITETVHWEPTRKARKMCKKPQMCKQPLARVSVIVCDHHDLSKHGALKMCW